VNGAAGVAQPDDHVGIMPRGPGAVFVIG